MPAIPSNDPTPPNLVKEIAKMQKQIVALENRLNTNRGDQTSRKELVYSHAGPVIERSRSTPYVVNFTTGDIVGFSVGSKVAGSTATKIAVFINDAVADTIDLDPGDKAVAEDDLEISVTFGDRVQVAVVNKGKGMSGITISLTLEYLNEYPL